ncbi:MAG: DUF5597 domain-containing protein [Limisphaerales bacterium]
MGARRRLWSPLETGAPDPGTPGQRHYVRRPAAHERPASESQGGYYTLEVTPARPRGASGTTPPQQSAPSVALFIATGPDEYFVVGNGARATFSSNTLGTPLAGIGTVEEGTFVNGRWVPGRWLAGDDTEQGDYLFLRNMGILRVTVYRYR